MKKWIMEIPVLSTLHLPGWAALDKLPGWAVAKIPDADMYTAFVFVDEEWDYIGDKAWFPPLKRWVDEHYPEHSWVRFDPVGDIIPELPRYDEAWD